MQIFPISLHLLSHSPKKAIVGLNSAVAEMDRRYDLMSELRTKDIDSDIIAKQELKEWENFLSCDYY